MYVRLISEMAQIKGVYNVLNHVPEKLNKVGNRMGDNTSRKVALETIDKLSVDYDRLAVNAKTQVEQLWNGSFGLRVRTAKARASDVRGYVILADNVGRVSSNCLATLKFPMLSYVKTAVCIVFYSSMFWSLLEINLTYSF